MSLQSLVYRLIKGSPLTAAEGDANLRTLKNGVNGLEAILNTALNLDGTLKAGAVSSATQIADGIITAAKLTAAAAASLVPTGTIIAFGGSSVPTGWLYCDGAAVSRSGATLALFTAIDVAWGVGNGTTTFNLPDLRRKSLFGDGGSGTGTLGNAIGNTGGAESVALSTAELASHSHTSPAVNGNTLGFAVHATSGNTYAGTDGTFAEIGFNVNTNTAGSGTAHNNLQPSSIVKFIIKT